MPSTPAKEGEKAPSGLPGVAAEKDVLLGAASRRLAIEHMEGSSVYDVLGALPRCSVAHFACHWSSHHGPIPERANPAVMERRGPHAIPPRR